MFRLSLKVTFSLLLLLLASCGSSGQNQKIKIRLLDLNGKPKRAQVKTLKFNQQILTQIAEAEKNGGIGSVNFEDRSTSSNNFPKLKNGDPAIDNNNQINKINSEVNTDFGKFSSDNLDNIFVNKGQNAQLQPSGDAKISSGDLNAMPRQNGNKTHKIKPSNKIQEIPTSIENESQQTINFNKSSEELTKVEEGEFGKPKNRISKNIILRPELEGKNNNRFNFNGANGQKNNGQKNNGQKNNNQKNKIQIGVFSDIRNAKQALAKNKKFGNVSIISAKNGSKISYKVLIGPFKNNAQALNVAEKIKKAGGDAVLVN
jgi:hypothetical protein